MTMTTALRCYEVSYDRLLDSIYNADVEGVLKDEDVKRIASNIIDEVDNHLPGSMMWMPHTSEIWVDITDDADIDKEAFDEIFSDAFWTVMSLEEEDMG
jgi:hypothetical protein